MIESVELGNFLSHNDTKLEFGGAGLSAGSAGQPAG